MLVRKYFRQSAYMHSVAGAGSTARGVRTILISLFAVDVIRTVNFNVPVSLCELRDISVPNRLASHNLGRKKVFIIPSLSDYTLKATSHKPLLADIDCTYARINLNGRLWTVLSGNHGYSCRAALLSTSGA